MFVGVGASWGMQASPRSFSIDAASKVAPPRNNSVMTVASCAVLSPATILGFSSDSQRPFHQTASTRVCSIHRPVSPAVEMAFTSVRPCQARGAVHAFASGSGSLRPTVRVACKAHVQDCAIPSTSCSSSSCCTQREQHQQLLSGVAAAASAALLLLSPLPACAVSGGGGISTPLSGQDLSNQDLHTNKYTKAVLRKTNFEGSNLTGVSFFSALAEGANFKGANLSLADLESGNFEDADFTDAILAGAFVNNAQLKGAKVTNTDWSDVVMRKDMQQYLCSIAEGTNPTTGVDTRESLLCP